VRHGRARLALAAAEQLGALEWRGDWTRSRLLDDARKMHAEMAGDRRPFGPPWGAAIEGGLAWAAGDATGAREALGRAVAGFDRAGMALYREAARLRLAGLTGAVAERESAAGWIRAQGVTDVAGLARALVPGYGPVTA
jgi:hypothetical protein